MTTPALAAAGAGLAAGLALAFAEQAARLRDLGDGAGSPTAGGPRETLQRFAARGRHRPLRLALLTTAVALVVLPLWLAALGGLGAGSGLVLRRVGVARRHRADCERGVPALARSLADALRGGSSIRAALSAAADDRSVPLALRRAAREVSTSVELGGSVIEALHDLSTAGGAGLRLLCGTVAMHVEAGGALGGALDRLAVDTEAARRVDEERIAATAQARATVRVVAALPLLALGGAEAASRSFLATISGNPLALGLLLCGLALEVGAVLAARAIVGPAR